MSQTATGHEARVKVCTHVTEKVSPIMEPRSWATMPLNVIEKIVYFAVRETGIDFWRSYGPNERPMAIRNYALVCTRWQEAVLCSQSIFRSDYQYHICIGEPNSELLIQEGFLGVAKGIRLSEKTSLSELEEAQLYYNGRSTEDYHADSLSPAMFENFADIIKKSTKARYFNFTVNLESEQDARNFWLLIKLAVNCNNLVKDIRVHLMTKFDNDWTFTLGEPCGEKNIKKLMFYHIGPAKRNASC